MIAGGDASFALRLGDNFPYDASDEWWRATNTRVEKGPPPKDWQHRAARGIYADLLDRRGIKQSLQDVDEDVRAECIESAATIIRTAMKEAGTLDHVESVKQVLLERGWPTLEDGSLRPLTMLPIDQLRRQLRYALYGYDEEHRPTSTHDANKTGVADRAS